MLCRVSEDEHCHGEHIGRQTKDIPLLFDVFHYISDIAGADPERLCRHDRVLCRDHGITYGKEQVSFSRITRATFGFFESRIPFEAVGAIHQHKFGLFDEWLMIAGYAEPVLLFLIRNS